MSTSEPVQVRYDLDRFAAEGGERHCNRDGWGIVIAEEFDAHYFREAAPAAESPLDEFVRNHATPHRSVVAHVRRASAGKRSLANTHPFRRVRRGRVHHFAHNGTLHGVEDLPEAIRLVSECVGETDSELAFLVLLDRLEQQARDLLDIDARFEVFRTFSAEMAALGPSNFLWLDGATLYVHADRRRHETDEGLTPAKPPGLHMLDAGVGTLGDSHHCSGAKINDLPGRLVLLASVPLSDADWEPLSQGDVLAVADGLVLRHGSTLSSLEKTR